MRKLIVDDSSNVRSITHQPDLGALDVEFASGSRYRYAGCTLDDFATACHAPSVGRWVQMALVKGGDRHPVERLPVVVPSMPAVDRYLVALQVIASMRLPGVESPAVDVARAALEGRTPPPLPAGWGKPSALDGRVVMGLGLHASTAQSMTPDDVEGIAYAMLAAAMEARS